MAAFAAQPSQEHPHQHGRVEPIRLGPKADRGWAIIGALEVQRDGEIILKRTNIGVRGRCWCYRIDRLPGGGNITAHRVTGLMP
jgi:hypothetical protein